MDIIKEDVFRKQIKKGLSGGYLFFGEEDYLKSFSLRAAREAICPDETFAVFNEIKMDSLTYSPSALTDALMPPPMMADQKLITVSGLAVSDMKPSEIEELCSALEGLTEYDYNVLIISVPAGLIDEGNLPKAPSKILNTLSKYLTPVQFDQISGQRLISWVGKHFEHNGVSAAPEVCASLIERCGRSMYTLGSETEKISYYVLSKQRQTVALKDIQEISPSAIETDAYAFTNALLDGKYAAAMEALNVMKFNRIDPIIVLSEVSKTVCDMLAVKVMQLDGRSTGEMANALKMRSDYKARIYAAACASKPKEKLERALLLCSEADLNLKLSPQGYIAIERLICSL